MKNTFIYIEKEDNISNMSNTSNMDNISNTGKPSNANGYKGKQYLL